MARLRTDNVFGTVTDDPLTNVATTLNSAGLANLVAVTGTDVAVITLDPNRVNGAPEIVYVTAHTGSATSATILRGQEGTAARAHPAGTFWVHGWTALDAGIGVLGHAENSAAQGSVTSEVDVTGCTLTRTVAANRRIRVTAQFHVESTVATDEIVVQIKEDGARIKYLQVSPGVANRATTKTGYHVYTPAAGSHTWKLTVQRSIGTGTVTVLGTVDREASITVEDTGAA